MSSKRKGRGSGRRFGVAARLTAAFAGLAGLAAIAGGASSWFSLQSAGIVNGLGARSLPTVTASLTFAQQSATLVAEAPALASQTDAVALSEKASRLDEILADQTKRLAELRKMVEIPSILDTVEQHSHDLAPKLADLKAAAAERIAVRDKIGKAVAAALSRYQDLMDFVRPLQEAVQTSVDGEVDALGKATDAEQVKALNTDLRTLQAAMDIQANGNLAFGMLSAVANASEDAMGDIRNQYNWAELHLGKAVKGFGAGSDADRLAPLVKGLLDLGSGQDSIFALRARETEVGNRITSLLDDLNLSTAALADDVKFLVSSEQGAARVAVDRSSAVTRQTLLVNAVTSGLVMLMALLLIVYVRRSVTRRLTALAGIMGRLAAGDRGATVAVSGRDEVTDMAAAVQVFRQNMIRNDELAAETARLAAAEEASRVASEAERAEAAERQATVVQGLAAGLTGLAQGDLTQELATPFAPEYESLRHDFNAALGQLRATMSEVVGNADGLRTGTSEIAGAADDLSRRTENQAASLEETAAALGEVTGALRKTAEGAAHARDVVGLAKTQAEQSGAVMRDAVAAMGAIEASSDKIGQIIGVVDEIAFQTNLLALNAGVEAARAGEAGRGFAVVASEVRALAQRSAEAAKEIKALVSSSRTQVARGVELVGHGGEVLGRVLTEVSEINTIVSEIARAANEQMMGLDQVNIAVTQMDQVTQQNAAMVEETTAASHGLAQDIEALVTLMGRFQLAGVAPVRSTGRPKAAASVAASRRGGAALARKAEAEPAVEEGWAEF